MGKAEGGEGREAWQGGAEGVAKSSRPSDLTILPKAEPESTRKPKGRKLETTHKREEAVDAKEEVVDPHVFNVDHRHDQLLVLVLQQLGLHHVQQLSDNLLHNRVRKISKPGKQWPLLRRQYCTNLL